MFENLWQAAESLEPRHGVTQADVMVMPDPLKSTLNKMLRIGGLSLGEFAASLRISEPEARRIGALLSEKHIVTPIEQEFGGSLRYELRLHSHSLPGMSGAHNGHYQGQ